MGKQADLPQESGRGWFWSVCAVAACAFAWCALWTFDVGDWPSPQQFPHNQPVVNACGTAGSWLAYELFHTLGDGAFALVLFASFATVTRLLHGRIARFGQRVVGLALLIACTSAAVHLIAGGSTGGMVMGRGGVVGVALGELIDRYFSGLGTVIVIGYAAVVGLILTAEGWMLRVPHALRYVARASTQAASAAGRTAAAASGAATRVGTAVADAGRASLKDAQAAVSARRTAIATDADDAGARATDDAGIVDVDDKAPAIAIVAPSDAVNPATEADEANVDQEDDDTGYEYEYEYEYVDEDEGETEDDQEEFLAAEEEDPEDAPEKEVSPLIVRHFQRQKPPAPAEAYPKALDDWTFPPLSLLEDPEYAFSAQQESIVRSKAKVLERTLTEFRIDAQVVEIDTGPVITVYELSLAPGIKVSQISSLTNDMARALKATAIRVVAPIPGKNTVGIEVPNAEKERVRLKELLSVGGSRAKKMALPLFLGKDASGNALIGDLAGMPHMLIAGTTGSGKSVCINSIVASILMTQRPDRCKLILVDPKMVEMSQFKEVPHLMCPIVTDMSRAESILEWAVTKMEERYELLSELRVRNIASFNALGEEEIYKRLEPANAEERARIATHLPYIVIIIDELADLMMTSAKVVEHNLARLAQKSRAVGIHIVVATQRPEAKVVTGLIKSNLPCRIAFRVASRMDSRIVLDQNGAEVLMGQGDMLFLPPGSAKLVRAQGTYLEDSELHAVIDDLTERSEPEFHPELVQMQTCDPNDLADRDPLFDKAVRVVLESKRGSVSLLQRRLTIGYSRASRLIEQMAEAGIVGTYKGSQAREVTMTIEEWDNLQRNITADKEAGYESDQDDAEDLDDCDTSVAD